MKSVVILSIIIVVGLVGVASSFLLVPSSPPTVVETVPPPPQLDPIPPPESGFELRGARGLVDGITSDSSWIIGGEWRLNCGGTACLAAPYNNYYRDIRFEMTHDMERPDGSGAHSHTYTRFNATSLAGSDDTLRISGPIIGSGPVGVTEITISLNFVTGEFSFELLGNEHLQGEVSGLIDDFLG